MSEPVACPPAVSKQPTLSVCVWELWLELVVVGGRVEGVGQLYQKLALSTLQ